MQGLSEFLIETDHKPLIPIINSKLLNELSPRIQRLRMRLLRFRIKANYVPGKDLLDADSFSRAPVSQPSVGDQLLEQEVETHIRVVFQQMPATSKRLQEIVNATAADKTLQLLKSYIAHNWPNSKKECEVDIQPYFEHRGALTYINGLILNADRIVIPHSLRIEMLHKIHEGHLGIEKCKRRARSSVFWPKMNDDIEILIKRCDICLQVLPSKEVDHYYPTLYLQNHGRN